MHQLIVVRQKSPGEYSAQFPGIPELETTASSKDQAIEKLRQLVGAWMASGQLVETEMAQENPLLKWFGHAKDDPDFDLYLEEIHRFRQEVDARECPNSSSTPTA
jgi:hypothetical protein